MTIVLYLMIIVFFSLLLVVLGLAIRQIEEERRSAQFWNDADHRNLQ